MYLVVYDIKDDKLRGRFAKFLSRFGRRLQYSVFEIKNSQRILDNIKTKLDHEYQKRFDQGDSVLIFRIPDNACVSRYGYPVNEEDDLVIK
ncbi:MAG: CRISPR-associated endonuclease Cas2 [bacterium]|nr:CRISPR-associated endonuclease Cas2 [bacterium]